MCLPRCKRRSLWSPESLGRPIMKAQCHVTQPLVGPGTESYSEEERTAQAPRSLLEYTRTATRGCARRGIRVAQALHADLRQPRKHGHASSNWMALRSKDVGYTIEKPQSNQVRLVIGVSAPEIGSSLVCAEGGEEDRTSSTVPCLLCLLMTSNQSSSGSLTELLAVYVVVQHMYTNLVVNHKTTEARCLCRPASEACRELVFPKAAGGCPERHADLPLNVLGPTTFSSMVIVLFSHSCSQSAMTSLNIVHAA